MSPVRSVTYVSGRTSISYIEGPPVAN